MAIETWYVLEDGSVGDPRDILTGEDGKLRHKDGRAVAYAPHGPRSRGGVDADAERAKAKPKAEPKAEPKAQRDWTKPAPKVKDEPPKSDRQMKAEGGQTYKTR